jgi:nascent polypeptide-associated complex subunit beta
MNAHGGTVHAAVTANTFAIYGNAQNKELTELVPGILNQLGPESLNSLKKLAESYQSMQQGQHGAGQQAGAGDPDDDDVPVRSALPYLPDFES